MRPRYRAASAWTNRPHTFVWPTLPSGRIGGASRPGGGAAAASAAHDGVPTSTANSGKPTASFAATTASADAQSYWPGASSMRSQRSSQRLPPAPAWRARVIQAIWPLRGSPGTAAPSGSTFARPKRGSFAETDGARGVLGGGAVTSDASSSWGVLASWTGATPAGAPPGGAGAAPVGVEVGVGAVATPTVTSALTGLAPLALTWTRYVP